MSIIFLFCDFCSIFVKYFKNYEKIQFLQTLGGDEIFIFDPKSKNIFLLFNDESECDIVHIKSESNGLIDLTKDSDEISQQLGEDDLLNMTDDIDNIKFINDDVKKYLLDSIDNEFYEFII